MLNECTLRHMQLNIAVLGQFWQEKQWLKLPTCFGIGAFASDKVPRMRAASNTTLPPSEWPATNMGDFPLVQTEGHLLGAC